MKLMLSLLIMTLSNFIKPNNNWNLMIMFMTSIVIICSTLNYLNKMSFMYMLIIMMMTSSTLMMTMYLMMNSNNFKLHFNFILLIMLMTMTINPLMQFSMTLNSMNPLKTISLMFKMFNNSMNYKMWIIMMLILTFMNSINLMIMKTKNSMRKI